MDQHKEIPLQASYERHKEYFNSSVHFDHQEELQSWLKDIYERIIAENDHDEIMRFQGRAQAMQEMLALPQRILDSFEIEAERKS